MITDLELIFSPIAGKKIVRCYRMRLGDQTLGLLGDENNRMLAICAHRLTPALDRWLDGRDLREPYVCSAALACVFGVGYVFASLWAEDWMPQNPDLMRELQKIVRPVLLGECPSALAACEGGVA